jgi:hypothetical protein
MIGYASNTGTRRNLNALRERGWRILLTPDNPRPPENLRFAIDNGAWKAFQQKIPFDNEAFGGLVERYGSAADFVVLPDIVAGGKDSLAFSVSWLPRLSTLKHLLLPIQDGMSHHEVGIVLRQNPKVGLFLGGSTEYKLREMYAWGAVAHAWKRWYHVGRVNTRRRIRLCAEAGADSFDGTSATMYASTLPLLDAAARFSSLLSPARMMGIAEQV